GQVERGVGATVGVPHVQPDRDRDRSGDDDRQDADLQVLDETIRDAEGPGPVLWVGEEADELVHQRAPARARDQGVIRRSTRTRRKSALNASRIDSTAPRMSFVGKKVWMPSVISWPRPPNASPRTATIVASPIVVTVARRTPAIINGTASGSSTRSSRWRRV